MDGDSDEDDITEDCEEDIIIHKGERENFIGSIGSKSAAKQVTEIVDIFQLFFNRDLIDELLKTETETLNSFYTGINYQVHKLLGHGNL